MKQSDSTLLPIDDPESFSGMFELGHPVAAGATCWSK